MSDIRPAALISSVEVSSVEGTLSQKVHVASSVVRSCEHTMVLATGAYRAAMAFNLMPDVVILKKLFGEVVISNVRAEVRQDALIGAEDGDVLANGRVYVAIIPSGKNTDAASGTNADVIMSVRRKQAFPLSSTTQQNTVFTFDLSGFEVDVAQDPRKQQGPVAWAGNTGIVPYTKGQRISICSITWYYDCTCNGVSAIW